MIDSNILLAMQEALQASMSVVRTAQARRGDRFDLENNDKLDGTTVTKVDKRSERIGGKFLMDLSVHAEEGGFKKGAVDLKNARYQVLFDPLDGTRPFINGAPTSTVILGLFDKELQQVVACFVGEPCSQGFWKLKDNVTHACHFVEAGTSFPVEVSRPCSVWQGDLSLKSTVYLDLYPGFTRKGCKALSVEEQSRLFSSIHGTVSAVSMMGSNGLHHALVANGGEGVIGAITTAIGGPWDVAPVILVLMAGGAACAFSRTEEGEWFKRDPLDVYSYDFLVTGNSVETVETLSQILTSL